MVIVITLIAIKTSISPLGDNPCAFDIAMLESFIKTINKGIITGKLKTAIIVLLLPVLELMPETIVNTDAKLILPNSTATR